MKSIRPLFRNIPWLVFFLWSVFQISVFLELAERGESPIDFLAYRIAANKLERNANPYLTPDESLEIWRYFHQVEQELLTAGTRDERQAKSREIQSHSISPGPYLYPPTLALLISQLHITDVVFGGLILLSILGFGWIWLRSTNGNSFWLMLIVLSWDVLASLRGGNVELVLLFAALLAARLLWDQRAVFAAPLIALIVLIKPFYAVFFIAFGLLQLVGRAKAIRSTFKTLGVSAGITLVLVLFEVYRWGPKLRNQAFQCLTHTLDYTWFVLPITEQTPMSIWNRTPMQALVNLGLPAPDAQWAAFVLWLPFMVITVWRVQGIDLNFPFTFGLSFLLLYWGRPVGWTLNYLEFVLVGTIWPTLKRWQKRTLLGIVGLFMASHWWALVLAIRGYGMSLFTLQNVDFPWETWFVIPLSWLLVLNRSHISRC